MQVKILKEAGYAEALLGLSLSFYDHAMPLLDWNFFELNPDITKCRKYSNDMEAFWSTERFIKAQKIALHLATKQPAEAYEVHNNATYISAEQKFLEQIDVWVYIQASRDFWSEFDTYRVDMSKQSSSTMHTLSKRKAVIADFAEGTNHLAVEALNLAIESYHSEFGDYHNISILKKNLPEGWLQERVIKTSYKTLKWILEQRDGHRLASWKKFREEIHKQIGHPEFILPVTNTGEYHDL